MTLQQLRYFAEVARTLHFTRAAQNLYITPSALSVSVSSLEHELKVPLFLRENGRNVVLTRYGEALLPMAEDAIKCFENIETSMHDMRDPLSGVVNISYSYLNGYRFVPKMFSKFREENGFRDISLNFEINHTITHFEDDVAAGNLDLAFSCTPHTEGLTVVPFARQELYVMLSVHHPLADRESLTIDDIAGETLIGYDQNRNLDRRINEMFRVCGLKPNIENYQIDWFVQLSLVALGKGIAILPTLPFENDLIRAVRLDHPLHIRDVYMMWASSGKLPPVVEYVRDYCLNFFSEPPLI